MTEVDKERAFADCAEELWENSKDYVGSMVRMCGLKSIPADQLPHIQKQAFIFGAMSVLRTLESSGRTGMVQ